LWYRPPDVLLGNKEYEATIDVWSIGCIFAEMCTGKALFAGLNDDNQTKQIFRILGTPSVKDYPGLLDLPGWDPEKFEQHQPQDLKQYVPNLDDNGFDLLTKLLMIQPDKRITLPEALEHKYFADLPDKVKNLYKK